MIENIYSVFGLFGFLVRNIKDKPLEVGHGPMILSLKIKCATPVNLKKESQAVLKRDGRKDKTGYKSYNPGFLIELTLNRLEISSAATSESKVNIITQEQISKIAISTPADMDESE